MQVGIVASVLQQSGMSALLHDFAVIEHEDPVGVSHCRYAMGNQDRGAPVHHVCQSIENALFGERVHARERVIQDQHARIA